MNYNMKTVFTKATTAKKAAMFGLDARIALAIFGALSVISGAALYSAIQQSKVTALAVDMQEMAKAFEAYYLDVGFEFDKLDGAIYDCVELIQSVKPGWKGPYISYPIDPGHSGVYANRHLDYTKLKETFMMFSEYKNSTFSVTSGVAVNPNFCVSDDDCAMYVTFEQMTGKKDLVNMRDELDKLIDNGDGLDKGKVRAFSYDNGVNDYLFFKIMDRGNYV